MLSSIDLFVNQISRYINFPAERIKNCIYQHCKIASRQHLGVKIDDVRGFYCFCQVLREVFKSHAEVYFFCECLKVCESHRHVFRGEIIQSIIVFKSLNFIKIYCVCNIEPRLICPTFVFAFRLENTGSTYSLVSEESL